MNNSRTPTQKPVGAQRPNLVRLIIIVLLVLIVLIGLTVLIIWLTIKPKKLAYFIEDGSIHNYNLSNNHLTATYNLVLLAKNPNKRVSVYYDKLELAVLYDDETISRGTISPFHQPKRNSTRFKLNLASRDVGLPEQVSRDLKTERSSGKVKLGVKLKARVHVKVGGWKSRHYHMKVSCAPIVHFPPSSKGFQRTKCDVDI